MNFGKMLLLLLGLATVILMITIPDDEASRTSGVSLPASQQRDVSEIALPQLGGGSWSLAEHKGPVVVLNFWASWCPPCQAETPYFVSIANTYRSRGVDVVGVSMDNTNMGAVRAFAARYKIPYSILLAPERSDLHNSVDEYPMTFLIDRRSRVVERYIGEFDQQQFTQDLLKALHQP